jgi:hypothetical protein
MAELFRFLCFYACFFQDQPSPCVKSSAKKLFNALCVVSKTRSTPTHLIKQRTESMAAQGNTGRPLAAFSRRRLAGNRVRLNTASLQKVPPYHKCTNSLAHLRILLRPRSCSPTRIPESNSPDRAADRLFCSHLHPSLQMHDKA